MYHFGNTGYFGAYWLAGKLFPTSTEASPSTKPTN
jgi:hypothetical protein